MHFAFDDDPMNFLYMNGVIDTDETDENIFVKFPNPLVQKRLFNYFSRDLFKNMGKFHEPFEDISDTINENHLNIRNLIRRHEQHLIKNKDWLLKDVPRRKDMRIFEAVFHFNLYRYLCDFLDSKRAKVYPEFPTGNGRVDLLIKHNEKHYAIEVKSYTDNFGYTEALNQAAGYGKKLGLAEITLVFFVEYIDDKNRGIFEKDYEDAGSGVIVKPVFVETGE